jgi:8-oxo-dGTP pyrophosphatase MutT (NUDIX family)
MANQHSSDLKPAVVGVVLLRGDHSALLQHRDDIPSIADPGLWVFPGGHADLGETLRAAAVRELEEETCYRSDNLKPLITFHSRDLGYSEGFEIVFFWDIYDEAQPVECREGQALKFIGRAAVELLPCRDYLTRVWDLALQADGSLPKIDSLIISKTKP